MKGLLVKDFKLMLAQKNYYLILVLLAACAAYFSANVAMIFTFLCVVVPMFTLSSVSYDQFDNGFPFLFSLPITRKSYVLEKYTFALILEGISLLLAAVLSVGTSAMLDGGADMASALSELVVMIPLMGCLVLTILSVMIPVHLKYGAEKGRVVLIILVGGLVALAYLVSRLMQMAGGEPVAVTKLLQKLERMGMGPVILAALVATGAVVAVSLAVSMRIMRKKEY